MRYAHVKAIAAVGNFGQIGNRGRLPWHEPADLATFKAITMGGICVVGKHTAETLPPLAGRTVVVWRRDDNPIEFAEANQHRPIWICGGAHIYRAWMPYISTSIISHIDYDGRADTFMPWLWQTRKKETKP